MWIQCPCGALVHDIESHQVWHETYPIPPALLTKESPNA